ncbi:hypothetical protein FZCC0069_07210 [Rhodobacterales bacterium FZCC0069]|nr:hypothetical protein [Rhodobacterales bacterium FZCC0069]
MSVNSWVNGPQAPLVYWSPTALTLTAEGGVFSGGTVRLVAHYIQLSLPDWVLPAANFESALGFQICYTCYIGRLN